MRSLGLWQPPTVCSACGQDQGIVDAHWETYARPFDTARDIPLCFRCHMMVHMRHRHPHAWDKYRALVRSGFRAAPLFTRGVGAVVRDHVSAPDLSGWIEATAPERHPLDNIDAGCTSPTQTNKTPPPHPADAAEPPQLDIPSETGLHTGA